MNITSRRGAIAFFVTLGICLAGLTLALNVGWIVLNWRRVSLLVVGVFFFSVLMAGVILNTIFLVREIRRNERHDSFLNAVTHELKTPLASIRLYLETLQRRPIDEAQRQQFYSIMLSDSDRLLATVEQVLKAGEIGQRKDEQPHMELDLSALAADCVTLARQRHHLDDRAIRIEPAVAGPPLLVSGNSEELHTVLLNLIDNAVKYSASGVAIRIQLASENGEWAVLRVVDSGMGIPPAHLKRVFKRFYRVPSMGVLKTKGTGLGLFIVRSIVRQHGGEVEARSDGFGKGTTMEVRLPLAGQGSRAGRKDSAMKKAASL